MVKHVSRWQSKGGVEDLQKASHLLAMLIEHEEGSTMTDDEYEALEERAAIIQFCSGREVSRTDAWRMACEQASQQAAKVIKAQQELASAQ